MMLFACQDAETVGCTSAAAHLPAIATSPTGEAHLLKTSAGRSAARTIKRNTLRPWALADLLQPGPSSSIVKWLIAITNCSFTLATIADSL